MATKIKGIYKGFKYFTQIFVVKDNRGDMEIGHPTDVKHVAHIGWDGPNGTAGPSWMNEFKTAPDFSTSIGSLNERRNPIPMSVTTSGSTRDFEDSKGNQPKPVMYQDMPNSSGATHVHKKHKRKKTKSTSSPKSSSRQSRASRSKANMYSELESSSPNCPTITAGSRQ